MALQNLTERVKREVGSSDNWVNYLEWLGVKVERPQGYLAKEGEEQ